MTYRSTRKWTAAAVLLTFLIDGSPEALAQAHMVGLGGQTCGAWTANSPSISGNTGIGLLYQQWVFGYLSGIGHADRTQDPLGGVQGEAVTDWLDNYCQSNPTVRIVDAASAFAREHHS